MSYGRNGRMQEHYYNDENSAHTHRKRFTTLTRLIKKPNILITTLQDAAKEFSTNSAQVPRRPVPSTFYEQQSEMAANFTPVPSASYNQQSGMAEKRRVKLMTREAPSREDFGRDDNHNFYDFKSSTSTPQSPAHSPTLPQETSQQLSPVKPLMEEKLFNKLQKNEKRLPPMISDWEALSAKSMAAALQVSHEFDNRLGYTPQPGVCCCQRAKRYVRCVMCGYIVKGNVKAVCPVHPQFNYLYAVEICGNSKCRAPRMFLEYNNNE